MTYNELLNLYDWEPVYITHNATKKSFESRDKLSCLFKNIAKINKEGYIKNIKNKLILAKINYTQNKSKEDEEINIISAIKMSKIIYFTKSMKIVNHIKENNRKRFVFRYKLVKSGKVISEASIVDSNGSIYLYNVRTIEEERRKGYSTYLIKLALKDIKQTLKEYGIDNYKSIYLHVDGERNPETNFRFKFYEKFGFKVIDGVRGMPYMEMDLK